MWFWFGSPLEERSAAMKQASERGLSGHVFVNSGLTMAQWPRALL
jgi:hypothetical protein